jgi:hypothetical protein
LPGHQAQQLVAGERHPVHPGPAPAALLHMLDRPGSFAPGQHTQAQLRAVVVQMTPVVWSERAHGAAGDAWLTSRSAAIP